MANVQYIDNIGIYKNILDPKWCDAVIKHFNKNEKNILDRQKDFGYDSKSVKDKAFFLQDPKLSSYILNILSSKIYEDYINKYPHVPVIQYEIEDLKIQKTEPSEGYHQWHSEWLDNEPCIKRYLVYTIYLNDIFSGGETEFLYQSYRIPPTKGTVVLFPAYFTHVHRGNPPLESTKYIMTGWFRSKNQFNEKQEIIIPKNR